MEIVDSHKKITIKEINQFETENKVKLTEQYRKFLLQWNGGYPEPSLFQIANEQCGSVLNKFYGIGDPYNNLVDYIDIFEYRLPEGFIPIADDPGGNIICLGTKEPYYENIYFWDHEHESENPDDMTNMYFLAKDIYAFLEKLYEDSEK